MSWILLYDKLNLAKIVKVGWSGLKQVEVGWNELSLIFWNLPTKRTGPQPKKTDVIRSLWVHKLKFVRK